MNKGAFQEAAEYLARKIEYTWILERWVSSMIFVENGTTVSIDDKAGTIVQYYGKRPEFLPLYVYLLTSWGWYE